MSKPNILIFDEQGFFYGSTQKLERQIAVILSREFNVFFACGRSAEIDTKEKELLQQSGITVIPFEYDRKEKLEPHKLVNMRLGIMEIINKNNIQCIYTPVFAHYQFPINSVPAGIPFILISPFGHYASNGNVYKTYVSGKDNLLRLKARGVNLPEVFFNPLTDFPNECINKPKVGEAVVFGRIGRDDDSIFDPISLYAFKKLEDKYGSKVKYIVVNAPPAWLKLAEELKIKNMEFRPTIKDFFTLTKFYTDIDVLAHARKDGETVGIAIIENMLAANPVVTHKSHFHNDHLDILDSSYARWCEADDIEAYFQNLVWMVENKNQIRTMGKLARVKAMELSSLEVQAPKIIQVFKQACLRCYHYKTFGKIRGYLRLYWENLKSLPFLFGKIVISKFPKAYNFLRKFYYK